jgi:glycosyltransferase involved in cell wall biosynthesis
LTKARDALKITVGVCAKNSERTIERAFEAMLNQKYPGERIQVIIVDGCSTDRTLRAPNGFARGDEETS